jgi:acetyl esterase
MPLDPLLEPLLDAYNATPQPTWTDAADRRRKVAEANRDGSPYAQFMRPAPGGVEVWEEKVEVTAPAGEIVVRFYRAEESAGPRGVLVHNHGGGWWSGGLSDVDIRCRTLAARAGVVVASVDYRTAPEFPFPTALHDVYAALLWTVEHAERLGIDPARVGVGGESAGGNLAAATALLARDSGGPALRLQLLEIPALDLTLSSPSARSYAEGFILTTEDLRWCVEQYVGNGDPADPLVSPLHAADLTGLPPAVITSAEYDPLRDDAQRYADRLAAAGVPVVYKSYPGLVHSAHIMTAVLPIAQEWEDDVVTAVRSHLA